MIPIQEQDCYITKVVYKKDTQVWYYRKHKVLPLGKTRKQAALIELAKAECVGCGEENKYVDWVFNDDIMAYELKNACEECFACGLLSGEDNDSSS